MSSPTASKRVSISCTAYGPGSGAPTTSTPTVDNFLSWAVLVSGHDAGHAIVREYVERVSGGKGKDKRTEFARMLDDAHKRQFDIVLCWALDRFSREGMVPTIGHLQRLAAAGVGFHSYTEPMLSTDNEMIRDIVLAVMASLAKQERLRHVERIHAGIARARVKGTQSGRPIGRPWLDKRKEAAVRAELGRGTGILKTAKICGVGTGTVQRIKREMVA
jgi:DNA invertase Pin-like site-specific DNA recombinase